MRFMTTVLCLTAFTSVAFARDGRPLNYEEDTAESKIPKASNELEEEAAKNSRIVRPARPRLAPGSAPLPGSFLSARQSEEMNLVDQESSDLFRDATTPAPVPTPSPDDPNLPEGWTCMPKVMMVEEIVYQDEVQCTHVFQESCFQSYKTVFKTAEVEECKETFKKDCFIEYHAVPKAEKVEVCQQPLVRDCDATDAAEVCSDEYGTVCETVYHENEVEDDIPNCETQTEDKDCDTSDPPVCKTKVPKQVCTVMKMTSTKLTPETDCRQEKRTVCGPESCPIVKGERVCAQEVKTFVQDVPEERCNLIPRKVCNPVTRIIPSLEAVNECMDIPKEICNTVQVAAEKKKTPVIKKWCGPDPNATTEDPSAGSTTEAPRPPPFR